MIFTMDIGNTNIKTALFNGPEMVKYWRISTSKTSTSDEYGVLLSNLFKHEEVKMDAVEGILRQQEEALQKQLLPLWERIRQK